MTRRRWRKCPRCPHPLHGTAECMDDACECDMPDLAEDLGDMEIEMCDCEACEAETCRAEDEAS